MLSDNPIAGITEVSTCPSLLSMQARHVRWALFRSVVVVEVIVQPFTPRPYKKSFGRELLIESDEQMSKMYDLI